MSNKKVVALTRPASRSDEAKILIESYNAEALIVPTLEIELLNSPTLKAFMEEVENMDWLIFTSVSSLDSIYKYYPDFNEKVNNKCKTAVIGHKTAEVAEKYGLKVDLIPKDYTAEGLLESFQEINIKDLTIGIPRTYSARKLLPEELEKKGAKVILAESYKSILPHDTNKINNLITKILNMDRLSRIEIFDNAHLFGTYNVSGMVTFIDGKHLQALLQSIIYLKLQIKEVMI